jgi:hypothetical protein
MSDEVPLSPIPNLVVETPQCSPYNLSIGGE